MSTKKKEVLTTGTEWRKHLRKVGKRLFWKKERTTQKKNDRQKATIINLSNSTIHY